MEINLINNILTDSKNGIEDIEKLLQDITLTVNMKEEQVCNFSFYS